MCLAAVLCLSGCGAPRSGGGGPETPASVDIAVQRKRRGAQAFEWEAFGPAAFARAKRERRYILLHGAAAWCHWCHVMEAVTYRDARVAEIVRKGFVAIKVDIDARPDIEERYGEWGWPATIVLSPDAAEVGKYRGYLTPPEMVSALKAAQNAGTVRADPAAEPGIHSALVSELDWIGARSLRDMDWYYDDKQGGWGMRQKAPLGENAEVELRRGSKRSIRRALFSLRKQSALIDPVWGGIYQYSAGGTWSEPHFEKLMTYQAPNLEAYAAAHRASKTKRYRRYARAIADYVDRFLTSPDGRFFPTQDADVGAHSDSARFVDGHEFYKLDDAGRRKLGMPRVDPGIYGYENGLMIAALVALHEADPQYPALRRAKRAANRLLKTHIDANGAVIHDPRSQSRVRFLADQAGLGRGLARLAQVTGSKRYRRAAVRIAKRMLKTLDDARTDALYASTEDPAAAGVFAKRRRPFTHNVLAARFLGALAKLTGDAAYATQGLRILAAVSTPAAIDQQGRMIGAYLLALDDCGESPWRRRERPAPKPTPEPSPAPAPSASSDAASPEQ